MILANFTGIFVELVRFYEIWPISRPLIIPGRKYFYKAIFESCGLEIGHLAAVYFWARQTRHVPYRMYCTIPNFLHVLYRCIGHVTAGGKPDTGRNRGGYATTGQDFLRSYGSAH
jgi:hypothetical protein